MVDLDWKVLQHFEDLLDNLVRWVASVRVLHQPLFEELAAAELQELVLNSFAFEVLTDLAQKLESVQCLVRGTNSLHDFTDRVMVLVICVRHLHE